jgi:enoyl-CoA hydratase/carnithine racemase
MFLMFLNRPKKANAVKWETLEEIQLCIDSEVNPYESKIRSIILAAEGKHFTSGIDMESAM